MAMMTSTSRNCDCEGEDIYDSNDGGGDNDSYKGSCGINVMIVYYECGGDYDSDSDNADGDNY